MVALTTADANMIEVHGMGGVGKNTLVKQVARQAMEEKPFDVIQTLNVLEIQGQVADMLGMKYDEESDWEELVDYIRG